jgi:Tfp pilus assembly protein FimT
MMGYMIAALLAVVAMLAVPMTVLVRRERRRMPLNPEAHRIEAAATRGFRGARRQAHAYQHFSDLNGVSALRDRDSRSY